MADQADLLTVLHGARGEILAQHRDRRIATREQRHALAARDLGCSFPGCTAPPTRCEAHHVTEWLDSGHTDIDNMCLLCRWHHHVFASRGWQVTMNRGMPEWIPPPHVDPERKPRRNHMHDPLRPGHRGTDR